MAFLCERFILGGKKPCDELLISKAADESGEEVPMPMFWEKENKEEKIKYVYVISFFIKLE